MKTSALIAALLLATTAVRAADMVIPFGEVTIPEAASHDVLAWLDTQAISASEQVEMVDPDDGHIYHITVSMVVAETPEVRLRRIIRDLVRDHIESSVHAHRIAAARAVFEAQLKVQMDAAEAIDLISEEVE